MIFWVYVTLFYMPSLIERARDPMDGWFAPTVAVRDLDCSALTTEGVTRLAPGQVPQSSPRGDYLERRATLCRERLMPRGSRRAQDDALLMGLRDTGTQLAGLVAEQPSEVQKRTWLVEVFHPRQHIASKVSFAVKNALLDRDLKVTDRTPTLAAGDIEVIGQTPANQAYPLACKRYRQAGSLRADDALLAVVLRDPRETILHAGLCVDGQWRWLR